MSDTTYIFRWDRHGRKGQRCVVVARGTLICPRLRGRQAASYCTVRFWRSQTLIQIKGPQMNSEREEIPNVSVQLRLRFPKQTGLI